MASWSEKSTVELARLARDPGFTPGARDVSRLLDLVCGEDEDEAEAGARAILRVRAPQPAGVAAWIIERARAATRPARGRLTRLVGRFAVAEPAVIDACRAWLATALRDADPKTRREAARALGNVGGDVEPALVAAFRAATHDDDRRPLAQAIAKVGTKDPEVLAALRSGGSKTTTRAALILSREAAREEPGAIDVTRAMPGLAVRFHTRTGLEEILRDEIGRGRASSGLVEAELSGPLSGALAVRTATHVGFPLPVARGADLADAIASSLLSPAAQRLLRTFTVGPRVRFRLVFERGHQRAVAWKVAEIVARGDGDLVNDPTASTWEVFVLQRRGEVELELVPRGYVDERFGWRGAAVPASSHPTIAAALARAAPRRDDDVVWDPFVGAGAELVERARLGPAARLLGTDLDPSAVDSAKQNLARAGVAAEILRGDALVVAKTIDGLTTILTNPPMGRRVERGGHVVLLERFIAEAGRALGAGGALVWTLPEPEHFASALEKAGFVTDKAWTVDMGGFPAELGVHRRTSSRLSRGRR